MTNQELVELAGTRVMGWWRPNISTHWALRSTLTVAAPYDWSPLTSLDDAEILVQKLRDGGEDLFGKFMEYMRWMPESLWGWFDDAKEKKCREIVEAALKAVGAEV